MNLPTVEIRPYAAIRFASYGAAFIILAFSVFFLWSIASQANSVFSFSFWLELPENAGRSGGIYPVLVSTFLIVSVCALISLPFGLATAAFLVVFTRADTRLSRCLRICLDALAATPSIVFGLFGAAFFGELLGLGFSILSGGLTLACMILPLLIRMTEKALREVPQEFSLQAEALGFSQVNLFIKVLVPLAAPALTATFILGIARALAETAALLFTSGYVLRTPESLLDSGRTLSIHIFDLAMNVPGGDAAAFSSALALLLILFIISLGATLFERRWSSSLELR